MRHPGCVPTTESVITDRIYAGVAVIAAVLTFVESPEPLWTIGAVLVALVPWALVATRRDPPAWLFLALAVLPVVAVVIVNDLGVVIFMTTAAASRFACRAEDRRAVLVVTVAVAVVPFIPALLGSSHPNGAGYFAFGDVFGVLVGVVLRRGDRLAARLREADNRLAEAKQLQERQRIARDVHDLVAHSLTVVVLHVGGARRLLRTDPEAAEAALADAERVCRESLDGIRGVVGLLRDTESSSSGLSLDLDALIGTYRTAGVDVRLTTTGDPAELPLGTRVTLYRVVQESMANAARYAPPGSAVTADVAVAPDEAACRIVNDRGAGAGRSGGFGLAGLREQVASADGVLTSGPEGDRWVVLCRLPVQQVSAVGVGGGA